MCGLAGFVTRRNRGISRGAVTQALQLLEHRGPDDAGIYSLSRNREYAGRDVSRHLENSWLTLLHRRLSILDLTEAGWQPMSSQDGRWHLVFNGEIYNYLELRDELQNLGYTFRSQTDSEVLLTALIAWGTGALTRLTGMFALALFDKTENQMLLARDCFGIKPLFYTQSADDFSFASEIKVLLETAGVPRRVNADRLLWYLRYGITDHGDRTMFEHIRQVPPAHFLRVDLDTLQVEEPTRYWQPVSNGPLDVSFDEAVVTVREMFLRNIELHLRSDVPVGMALSGGVDSSSIVMAARHVLGRQAELHTFSYIAADGKLSEEKWVDIVAAAAGAKAHKAQAGPRNLVAEMDEFVAIHDEPVGSTSVFAQDQVFRLAKECGIKVMLDGQGADELLGGYFPSVGARLASLVRRGKLIDALQFWRACSRLPGLGWLGSLLYAGDHLTPKPFQPLLRRLVGREVMPASIDEEWFRAHNASVPLLHQGGDEELFRGHLLNLVETLILPKLLRYEDRNSMAYSIESRVPFLTPQFASYLLSLPPEYIIARDGTTKSVFRASMRGIVPDTILERRDKIGFETPERNWLIEARPWVDEMLSSETARGITPLNIPAAQQEWERIAAGRQRFDFRIWRWLNLIAWSRKYQVEYDTTSYVANAPPIQKAA